MNTYDAIVIGLGGVGSAAAFHLARRGARVLGLDRFPAGHDQGSSHGQTRIIRKAYFEHADYVPLLQRAYALWSELEQLVGRSLYVQTGLVEVGPPGGEVLTGVLRAARQHNLTVEEIPASAFAQRFPGLLLPDDMQAVFESEAGYLHVEPCVVAHCEAAVKHGAELRFDAPVISWRSDGDGVVVESEAGSYSAGRLVIAAGAWSAALLQEVGVPLRVRRKHLHWFASDNPLYSAENGCPAFYYELPRGSFYGFPKIDQWGVKVAEHSGGLTIPDPLRDTRSIEPEDRRRVEWFRAHHLPGVSNRLTHHVVCYYTCSPDDHFLVDLYPGDERVSFAAGLSGHGFKFTSVLGEALADLALEGRTELPIAFFSCRRPGLIEP